jgi:UDP-N-acetylmuramyl pentapeptide phosphotransferase/UDP-N-acetylglucosamine-1-phosphate transferase
MSLLNHRFAGFLLFYPIFVKLQIILVPSKIKDMPKSKQRKHHHEQQQAPNLVKSDKTGSFVILLTIFFALLGMGIAFFATENSILWIAIGAIVGAVAGYLFAKQVERSFSKK